MGGIETGTARLALPLAGVDLAASLILPAAARGLVLVADGEAADLRPGCGPLLARILHEADLATLLVELSTEGERDDPPVGTSESVEIARLSTRLIAAIDWLSQHRPIASLPLGLLGVRRGAAAVLQAAAERPGVVLAVVSWNGRPDLAFDALARIVSPTLLMVGGEDVDLLELNSWAAARLQALHQMTVLSMDRPRPEGEEVQGQAAARQACDWFLQQLPRAAP